MPISHARFHPFFVIRFAEPPGVRELKSDHQIVGVAESFSMRLTRMFTNLSQALFVLSR